MSFTVGTILVGLEDHAVGSSRTPTFGRIAKITPAGRYRIVQLVPERYQHPSNVQGHNLLASFHAMRPLMSSLRSGHSWHAPSDGDALISSGSRDSEKLYGDYTDNGA